jgi:hypothetical protein
MSVGFHVKYPLFSSEKCLYALPKNSQIPSFMEILPVGPELFHSNRQTDRQTDRQRDGHDEANIRYL